MFKYASLLLSMMFCLQLASCGSDGGGAGAASGDTGSATLSWSTPSTYYDGSPLTVTGYKIYYGTESGYFDGAPIVLANVNTYTVTGLTKGLTYYFVVTAYDAAGVESDPTPEQSKSL